MLFLARIVDGLSGGNISTARAYVADITEPKDRARAYGLIGAAFGLGFIFGPALSGVLAKVSYTAPIWAAAGLTLVATAMAWLWLPETVHRAHAGTGNPFRYLPELLTRPIVRRVLLIDFVYWFAFAIFQTTFALFVAPRGSASTRRRPAIFSPASACSAPSSRAGSSGRSCTGSATRRRSSPASSSARSGWPRGPDALGADVRADPRAAVARDGLRDADDFEPRQPRGREARAGPRAGRRERGRKPQPDDRPRSGATPSLQQFTAAPYLSAAAFLC